MHLELRLFPPQGYVHRSMAPDTPVIYGSSAEVHYCITNPVSSWKQALAAWHVLPRFSCRLTCPGMLELKLLLIENRRDTRLLLCVMKILDSGRCSSTTFERWNAALYGVEMAAMRMLWRRKAMRVQKASRIYGICGCGLVHRIIYCSTFRKQ